MMAVTIERQPIDILPSFGWVSILHLSISLFLGWQLLQYLRQVFRSDLKKIPGPKWARVTVFWRPWVLRHGKAPDVYHELHQRYGPLVRTAPGVVSISDPKAITSIYGIGTKYYKASLIARIRVQGI